MVQFDGNVWKVFPLNNFSDVRSVLASTIQKRNLCRWWINEFGYYEPAEDGELILPLYVRIRLTTLFVCWQCGESMRRIISFVYKAMTV